MSHDYDFTSKIYDPLLYPALRGIRGAVTRALASHKHSKILDLCCGTGNQLKILSRAGFTDLHCLDISPGMLKVAGRGRPDYRIYEADARSTGFDDGMFDVVILSFAIHEKEPDTQRAMIGEAHRVLKKDGLLLVVDYLFDKKSFA
ncbi:class I SAM-dependent methyltransferase, partial [Myxococcota bacterium]|nr:class I SAM-dependent methyltransferase [Myxococcota bacterium]